MKNNVYSHSHPIWSVGGRGDGGGGGGGGGGEGGEGGKRGKEDRRGRSGMEGERIYLQLRLEQEEPI